MSGLPFLTAALVADSLSTLAIDVSPLPNVLWWIGITVVSTVTMWPVERRASWCRSVCAGPDLMRRRMGSVR